MPNVKMIDPTDRFAVEAANRAIRRREKEATFLRRHWNETSPGLSMDPENARKLEALADRRGISAVRLASQLALAGLEAALEAEAAERTACPRGNYKPTVKFKVTRGRWPRGE